MADPLLPYKNPSSSAVSTAFRTNLPAKIPGQGIKDVNHNNDLNKNTYTAPQKAVENVIPDDASLQSSINQALTARDKGVYWQRGSIINILL